MHIKYWTDKTRYTVICYLKSLSYMFSQRFRRPDVFILVGACRVHFPGSFVSFSRAVSFNYMYKLSAMSAIKILTRWPLREDMTIDQRLGVWPVLNLLFQNVCGLKRGIGRRQIVRLTCREQLKGSVCSLSSILTLARSNCRIFSA